jgi:hypothetical protein
MADPPRRILGEVADYSSFLRAVRARVAELDITHETLDAVSGLQSGYTSKLLASPPIRRMGPLTIFLMLQSLGMTLLLAEDKSALNVLNGRLVPRRTPRVIRARSITLSPDYFSRIARNGNAAKMIKFSPAKRSRIARKAARARWRKARAAAEGAGVAPPSK